MDCSQRCSYARSPAFRAAGRKPLTPAPQEPQVGAVRSTDHLLGTKITPAALPEAAASKPRGHVVHLTPKPTEEQVQTRSVSRLLYLLMVSISISFFT